MGTPTHRVLGLNSSSSCELSAATDDSAVTATATTVVIPIIDHQPLSQLCCFLSTISEYINRYFADGEETICNDLMKTTPEHETGNLLIIVHVIAFELFTRNDIAQY